MNDVPSKIMQCWLLVIIVSICYFYNQPKVETEVPASPMPSNYYLNRIIERGSVEEEEEISVEEFLRTAK